MIRAKYRNQKVKVDGVSFDSKLEAKRYMELRLLERADKIINLELQPRFLLQDKFKESMRDIVEDTRTDVFKLKLKLFLYKYPWIDFREVKK